MKPFAKRVFSTVAACLVVGDMRGVAHAETITSALARAYLESPEINQQRANVRIRDEDAPKALAGIRPNASIQANAGVQHSNIKLPLRVPIINKRIGIVDDYVGFPRGASFNVSQTLYDGGRSANAFLQAQSGAFAARTFMRLTEQATLLDAATAYMNVMRDTAILALRRNNVSVLAAQLKHTRERYHGGDVTHTDVSQAEASLAQARSDFYAAEAQLKASCASYQRIVGIEPRRLQPASSVERLLPKSVHEAIAVAQSEHPAIIAALHQTDAAEFGVKVAEGALLPTLTVGAQVFQQYDSFFAVPGSRQFSAGASATLNIPLYQGGAEYASIRQAKEQVGHARFNVDARRLGVRENVVISYSLLDTARAQVVAGRASVKAAEAALKGVREEAQVGQRTTQDVLNAQQALLGARVNLVVAQRDRVVASYTALAAIGRLSATTLNLGVPEYDPAIHFEQVKDIWSEAGTPGGR
jgi:outer membrane protein